MADVLAVQAATEIGNSGLADSAFSETLANFLLLGVLSRNFDKCIFRMVCVLAPVLLASVIIGG